ncbi:hypothetical protein Tco_0502106 [Tanacetum coccineum]
MGQTVQTMHMLTKPQAFYDDAHKTAIGYQNPLFLRIAQRKQLVLYNANILAERHDPIYVCDSEETLILAEEIRLKIKEKQKEHDDKPIDYAKLNKLYEYFVLQNCCRQNKSIGHLMVKDSLQKVENLLKNFDVCIKDITIVTATNWGNWRVSHVKDDYKEEVIPFVKNLRESFKLFKIGLYKEVNEMKAIFKQMENEDDQCSVGKKYFKIEKKQLLINNDRLLEDNISSDAMRVSYINASESQPQSNTRNDRIQRPSKRSENNKVEAQHRKFKSSSNKNIHVLDCNANVKNVALSSNYENVCLSYGPYRQEIANGQSCGLGCQCLRTSVDVLLIVEKRGQQGTICPEEKRIHKAEEDSRSWLTYKEILRKKQGPNVVTEKEPKEKRLEDVPVIRDFPEVFPDDLPGLPPPRQVEFKIGLVLGVAPVLRASY